METILTLLVVVAGISIAVTFLVGAVIGILQSVSDLS